MIRQAIKTCYKTDSEGSGYILAKSEAQSIRVNWDYSLEPGPNHIKAARLLADRLDWKWWVFATGCIDNEYFHVEYKI